jgi:hypothetical protein
VLDRGYDRDVDSGDASGSSLLPPVFTPYFCCTDPAIKHERMKEYMQMYRTYVGPPDTLPSLTTPTAHANRPHQPTDYIHKEREW